MAPMFVLAMDRSRGGWGGGNTLRPILEEGRAHTRNAPTTVQQKATAFRVLVSTIS